MNDQVRVTLHACIDGVLDCYYRMLWECYAAEVEAGWRRTKRRLMLVSIGAAALALWAGDAHAAVWDQVHYRPRVAASRIIAQRWQAPGPWLPATLWAGPGASYGADTAPKGAGLDYTAWVSTTQDPVAWRRGGQALRLAAVDAAGDTLPWSNYQLIVAGVPRDTLFLDAASLNPAWKYSKANALAPTIYEVVWVRAEWDTILVAPPLWPELNGRGPIVHFEDFELSQRCRICPIYHYLVRRAARDSTLCIGVCP